MPGGDGKTNTQPVSGWVVLEGSSGLLFLYSNQNVLKSWIIGVNDLDGRNE